MVHEVALDCSSGRHALGLVPAKIAQLLLLEARRGLCDEKARAEPRHRPYGFAQRCRVCDLFVVRIDDAECPGLVHLTAPTIADRCRQLFPADM